MNPSMNRRIVSLMLAIILIAGFPLRVLAEEQTADNTTAQTQPEETQPEEPQLEETQPEETQPEETQPEETRPEETHPEETYPEEPHPEETQPEETLPEGTKSEEAPPEEIQPTVPAESRNMPGLYFGLLHAHTNLSEGTGTPEETFRFAAELPGLDFFAVTDFSDSFDNQMSGEVGGDAATLSADWAAGKAAAAAVTTASFAGLFGYEMGWPSQMQIGHISSFGTPGFQSWMQEPYDKYDGALEQYLKTLASVPGAVSQFNHPGRQYGGFDRFRVWSEEADRAVSLLEVDFSEEDPCCYYIQALDQGWHLAPTASQPIFSGSWEDRGIRTAVVADALTENGILAALRDCRTYATQDPDLEIEYTMDGHPMGSRLDLRHVGEWADISVTLFDPSDEAGGLVEVIGDGEVIEKQTLSEAQGEIAFSLSPESGYYFLRITQPDGDMAITAPIWVDGEEELGIASLACTTAVPVQNEPVSLTVELFNEESADFLVESLTILADGIPVKMITDLPCISAGSSFSRELTFSCDCAGVTQIALELKGTLEGSPRSYTSSLQLSFRQSDQVTAIVADSTHGNKGIDRLSILKALAMDESIRFAVETEKITAGLLKNCRFLLVSAPSQPFSESFLAAAAEFAGFGGSIVLCGQADTEDDGFDSAAQLNRLLEAVGSTMRIQDDLAQDPVANNGDPCCINSKIINTGLSWCAGISGNQTYRVSYGCTVNPGDGTWIVKGRGTTQSMDGDRDGERGAAAGNVTLLACEALSGGGSIFAAGSLFLADEYMAQPQDLWEEPYANRIIAGNLLGIGGGAIPLSTIREARSGMKNELFRIRGYVTAGTSNSFNTFPNMIYVQDKTGGIAVTPFGGVSLQQGTPVEITGYAEIRDGNQALKVGTWEVLDGDMHQYLAKTGSWKTLLSTDSYGGTLVQVEGKCREIYCREDDTLAGCLLEDENGNFAVVKIEDYIRNGSDGENDLHKTIRKGRTVRAMGILHADEYGDTVIRVRNCEEVVWVPPRRYWNPKTGDSGLPAAMTSLALSSAGLLAVKKRKKT